MEPAENHRTLEGKACDAIIRHLERREGASRRALRRPELEPQIHSTARIDLACRIGNRRYAIEHTYTEPFEGFRALGILVRKITPVLQTFLDRDLSDTTNLELYLSVDEISGLDTKLFHDGLPQIARWIILTSPTLPPTPYGNRETGASTRLPGLPFSVSLRKWTTRINPIPFRIVLGKGGDLNADREARLRRAYSGKCPKLQVWRTQMRARTILIFQEDDISFTNQVLVGETIRRIEAQQIGKPSEIYLVSTVINPWFIYPIRIGRKWVYQSDLIRERAWEVDPAALDPITDSPHPKVFTSRA